MGVSKELKTVPVDKKITFPEKLLIGYLPMILSEIIRCIISDVPSKILVNLASLQ